MFKLSSHTIALIVMLSVLTGMLKSGIGETSEVSVFTLKEFIIGWGFILCLFALAYYSGRTDEKNKNKN